MSEIQRGDYVQLFNLGLPLKVAVVMFAGAGEYMLGLENGNLHPADYVRRVARIRIRSIKYKPTAHGSMLTKLRVAFPCGDDTTYWPGR